MGCAASTNPAAGNTVAGTKARTKPVDQAASTNADEPAARTKADDQAANPKAAFDPRRPYRLDPQVALRPEPFGALAYHYGNRRLTFVRAVELVDLLTDLADHDSLDAALAASPVPPARWPAFRKALASLADSEVIVAC